MMATNKVVQSQSNLKLDLPIHEIEKSAATSPHSINLDALDGYALPEYLDTGDRENIEGHGNTTNQPKKKKKKKGADILGVEYREREEKRLEELLFGDLLDKFSKKTEIFAAINNSETERKDPDLCDDDADVQEGTLPQDLYGNRLGLNKTYDKNPAWVDDDDEETK